MNISFLNYDTRYNAEINGKNISLLDKKQACFAKLFYDILGKLDDKSYPLHTEIILNFSYNHIADGYSNLVLLTKDELDYYFRELSNMIEFKYSLEQVSAEEYKLIIDVNGKPFALKWFMTCVRYIYEFPFAIALKDAVFLKRNKKFVNINLLNVFNIIGTCYYPNHGWNTNHTCGEHGDLLKLLNYTRLKDIINRNKPDNSVCDDVYHIAYSIRNNDNYLKFIPRIEDFNQDYFLEEAIYNRYKNIYFYNYKQLKLINNYIQK